MLPELDHHARVVLDRSSVPVLLQEVLSVPALSKAVHFQVDS